MKIKTQLDIVSALSGKYRNAGVCNRLAKEIRTHADGLFPDELIAKRRPSEPEEIFNYRKAIYVPKTKNPINKVIHSLEKIRRSQDFCIQYDSDAQLSSIADGETMQKYCEENYPGHTSVTNWAFSELLKQSLIDANGIVAVIPNRKPKDKGAYVKPEAVFFRSEQIVDYYEGEYAVLLSRDKTTYEVDGKDGKKTVTNGNIYYILTETECVRYEQVGSTKFSPEMVYTHNIGKLPAWRVGGIFLDRINNDNIYQSRIAAMVPDLNEAAREYSDLQAEIVMHIHSEKYAYTKDECPECHGNGYVPKEDGSRVVCEHCNGTGRVLNTSPFGMHLINVGNMTEQAVPTPPIGYIQKQTDIATLQDKRVRDHIYDALAAINMEFLAETPLSQSGTAKEVDKDELNNFVYSVAEDLVRNMDLVYYFIGEYRYGVIVKDEAKRRAMYPKIPVPQKFDIVSTTVAMEMLKSAREANANPEILREMEIEFAKKQFSLDPSIASRVETTFALDPLFGIKEEDKMTMLQNGGITKTAYCISCNIHTFVTRAVEENSKFYTLDYKAKMKKMEEYAKEIEDSAAETAKQSASMDFGGLGQGNGQNKQDKPTDAKNQPSNGNNNTDE